MNKLPTALSGLFAALSHLALLGVGIYSVLYLHKETWAPYPWIVTLTFLGTLFVSFLSGSLLFNIVKSNLRGGSKSEALRYIFIPACVVAPFLCLLYSTGLLIIFTWILAGVVPYWIANRKFKRKLQEHQP